jgi:predicted small lipoprotein YifL
MRRAIIILLLVFSMLAACGRPAPTPLPPADIVARTVTRMKSLTGFHFIIDRTGGPAYIDANRTLSLGRTEGDFSAPDRAQGQARIIAPGIVASVKFISVGGRYWQTNPLSGKWEEYAPGTFFNPATLFDREIGLPPILASDLLNLRLDGVEELKEMPGLQLYALTGKLAGERVAAMSGGLIGPAEMDIRLWVDPQTFDLVRIVIVEPAAGGAEATTWQIDFLDFNKPVDIQPPATATP